MINSIDMFKAGQRVAYIPMHAFGDITHPHVEKGKVNSVGEVSVFVKFDKTVAKLGYKGTTSQSCDPRDLVIL